MIEVKVKVKVNGMAEIQQAMHNLTLTLSPNRMQKAYQRIGEHLTATTKQRFDDSVDPDGNKWASNAQSTITATLRKKRESNKKPLIDSTQLRDSIRYQVFNEGVVVGTNRDFGINGKQVSSAVHQFGSKNGNIPARPFLGISHQDKRHILTDVMTHLTSAWQ